MKTLISSDGSGSAIFSDCGRYRFLLSRRLEGALLEEQVRWLNMLMLNPSKATHERSDPTVTRQGRRLGSSARRLFDERDA